MTIIFNKNSEKEKRRYLRNNSTFTEKLIWQYLRRKQVLGVRFLRQYSVDYFVLDFYAPKIKLAIEIDGFSHFESKEAVEYDKRRQEQIENYGISFIRFTNKEVRSNLDKVMEAIECRFDDMIKIPDTVFF